MHYGKRVVCKEKGTTTRCIGKNENWTGVKSGSRTHLKNDRVEPKFCKNEISNQIGSLISGTPQDLFLIIEAKSKPNLSADSAKLFLREPLKH